MLWNCLSIKMCIRDRYEGGYTDYLGTRQAKNAAIETQKNGTKGQEDKKKAKIKEWKQNTPDKLKFSYKEQKEYETIDETIEELEKRIGELDREMMANATNSVKLSSVIEEKEQAEAQLEEKMERWVYLNDLAEKIEAQKE